MLLIPTTNLDKNCKFTAGYNSIGDTPMD